MFKSFALCFMLPLFLFGGELQLVKGNISAHTEVFGDSSINPYTKKVHTAMKIGDKLSSLKGKIFFNVIDFVSDNKDRDIHMYEAMEAKSYEQVSFSLQKLTQKEGKYYADGILLLHGVKKHFTLPLRLKKERESIWLNALFSIKMSDFDITPPTLLFLTVRDKVDIKVMLELQGG